MLHQGAGGKSGAERQKLVEGEVGTFFAARQARGAWRTPVIRKWAVGPCSEEGPNRWWSVISSAVTDAPSSIGARRCGCQVN